jgi:hypothetical protein
MLIKSLLCYVSYYVFTAIVCVVMDDMRSAMLSEHVIAVAYIFGASIWFAIPGMINFWLNFKRGYMKWVQAGLVTAVSVVSLSVLFYSHLPVEAFLHTVVLLSIPISIVQIIVLCPIMEIKLTKNQIS